MLAIIANIMNLTLLEVSEAIMYELILQPAMYGLSGQRIANFTVN